MILKVSCERARRLGLLLAHGPHTTQPHAHGHVRSRTAAPGPGSQGTVPREHPTGDSDIPGCESERQRVPPARLRGSPGAAAGRRARSPLPHPTGGGQLVPAAVVAGAGRAGAGPGPAPAAGLLAEAPPRPTFAGPGAASGSKCGARSRCGLPSSGGNLRRPRPQSQGNSSQGNNPGVQLRLAPGVTLALGPATIPVPSRGWWPAGSGAPAVTRERASELLAGRREGDGPPLEPSARITPSRCAPAFHPTGGGFAGAGAPALSPLSVERRRLSRGEPHRGGHPLAGLTGGQAARRGARELPRAPTAERGPGAALCGGAPGCGPAALPRRASARPVPPAARRRAHAALCPAWFVIVNGRTIGTSALSSSIKAP